MSNPLVYTISAWNWTILAICALILGTLTSQASIWVGMTEKAAIAELRQPQSSIKVDEKEVHFYEDSRRIEIVDGVIQSQSGFPSSMVIEIEKPQAPLQAKEATKANSPFIDFKTATKASEESFTLTTNEVTNKEAAMAFLEETDPNILYLMGGGLLGTIGLLVYAIYKLIMRKRPLSSAAKRELVNSQLPPFLSAPRIKESTKAPSPPIPIAIAIPAKAAHSKRTSLSIRERKNYDDSQSEFPRKTLVKSSDTQSKPPVLSGADSDSSTKLKLRQD